MTANDIACSTSIAQMRNFYSVYIILFHFREKTGNALFIIMWRSEDEIPITEIADIIKTKEAAILMNTFSDT